ncbi:MAG TPA: type II toxin-antitoxin system VapC family toxin [Thermoflexales bacterium]|nr:type II toxin-antitoxin system VapC family toxin [Thermoflexales bacterium]
MLDTDHCVAILRRKLDPRSRVTANESLAVTAVTVAELTHGAHRSARAADNLMRVDALLAAVNVLDFDEASARLFGALKARLEVAGQPIDDIDLQIACIALRHESGLASHNAKHFGRVPGLKSIDWL